MPFAHPHRRSPAFTLIELITVMGVIAILMTITLSVVRGAKQRANVARTRVELSAIVQALEEYKRHYGDYPQTGPSAVNSQRVPNRTTGPGLTTAQARLLNALIGVYAPRDFNARLNGPALIDVSRMTLEVPFSSPTLVTTNLPTTFGVPTGTPPTKPPANNSFLDPWENRYLYFYKSVPPANGPQPAAWRAPSFVLYSSGPDGAATIPDSTGLFMGTTQTTGDNADNIYADKLP